MTPSRRVRRRPSRAVYRRRQVLAATAAVTVIALAFLSMSSVFASSPTTTTTTSTSSMTTTTLPTTTTTDPGSLPQTATEPPSDDASLTARLQPLYSAIQTNSTSTGMAVFFPESAYVTMKTGQIADPRSDYQNRLVAFFSLDLAAYQQVLGTAPAAATLISVNGDPSMAAWIPPGSCENSIGYWHLPNVRIVYRSGGVVESFGIASLISWRGLWYVVHLGPNPRPSDVGTVDQPATGPGTPGPAGGC